MISSLSKASEKQKQTSHQFWSPCVIPLLNPVVSSRDLTYPHVHPLARGHQHCLAYIYNTHDRSPSRIHTCVIEESLSLDSCWVQTAVSEKRLTKENFDQLRKEAGVRGSNDQLQKWIGYAAARMRWGAYRQRVNKSHHFVYASEWFEAWRYARFRLWRQVIITTVCKLC